MDAKELKEMNLHDKKVLFGPPGEEKEDDRHWVERVPGGWIYWYKSEIFQFSPHQDPVSISIAGVFVPE